MIAPWKNEKVRLIYDRPEVKASIEIILSVFTVAGLLLLAIRPTLATVASLQKKIEDQQIVDRRLEAKISQLIDAQKNMVTYADKIPEYEAAVPDLSDQGLLSKRIEVLAVENGLTINGLIFSSVPLLGQEINLADKKGRGKPETDSTGKITFFDISFDVSGDMNGVFSFISAIENMDRAVIVSEVNLKKEETSIKVVGRARSYYALKTP